MGWRESTKFFNQKGQIRAEEFTGGQGDGEKTEGEFLNVSPKYQSLNNPNSRNAIFSSESPIRSPDFLSSSMTRSEPKMTEEELSEEGANSSKNQKPDLSKTERGKNSNQTAPRNSNNWKKWGLVLTLTFQALGVIASLSSIYGAVDPRIRISEDGKLQTLLGYLVIFIAATIFSAYIAFDSVANKNSSQLIALCLFNLAMAVWGAILPVQILRSIKDFLPRQLFKTVLALFILVPSIIFLSSIFLIYLTYYFFKEFGWQSYKKLGGDIRLNAAFLTKTRFFMLQKFTFFFLIGFCVLIIQMRREVNNEFRLVDVMLPVMALVASGLVIVVATIAVELELRVFAVLYGIVWAAALAFLVYDAIRLHPLSEVTDSQHSLILFAFLTFMMLLFTGLMSLKCYRNFGLGLKEAKKPFFCCICQRRKPRSISSNGDSHLATPKPIKDTKSPGMENMTFSNNNHDPRLIIE